MRLISAGRLKRPRIDVTINASGLCLDIFSDKILFLDSVIPQAYAATDAGRF